MGFGPQKPQEGGWQGIPIAESWPLPRGPGFPSLQLLGRSLGGSGRHAAGNE